MTVAELIRQLSDMDASLHRSHYDASLNEEVQSIRWVLGELLQLLIQQAKDREP